MKSLWSGNGSHHARQAKPMNKRWRWCGLFLMLLALAALSVLSVRPDLLAATNTSTPMMDSSELMLEGPTERKERPLTPCEAAREKLARAEAAVTEAITQLDAARAARDRAVENAVKVLSNPNSTEAEKKAANDNVIDASEDVTLAEDAVAAAEDVANVAAAEVQDLCDTQPVEPNPDPLGPEPRDACCGLDVS